MMKMFILTTTLPLLPHDSCQQLANSFSHPCHSSLQHRISQYRFPYGLYFCQPTHAILYFLTKDLLRYESCTYPIKFLWQYDSNALQKCHQSAPLTSFTIPTLATCFSPISHDLSCSSDIGFHTIELLLTFNSQFSFLLNCNLNTYFPWLYPHSTCCIIWFHIIFFAHIMIPWISPSVNLLYPLLCHFVQLDHLLRDCTHSNDWLSCYNVN